MASYSATMITRGLNGSLMSGTGSFANISIDGRHHLQNAIEIARDVFKKEAGADYLGFAIEKTSRFVDYRNPRMIDTVKTAKEIAFLL